MSEEAREQLRIEDVRLETRACLYRLGMAVALSAADIARMLRRKLDFTEAEVRQACIYWQSHKVFEEVRQSGVATRHYKITAAGIDEYERSLV